MSLEDLLALRVFGEFHWGFSVRAVSESAAAHPYAVPPPSTLIGALSYGISKVTWLSECVKAQKGIASRALDLYSLVTWATFGFRETEGARESVVAYGYSDPVRLFRLPYQRGERHKWEYRDMWFGVAAHGKVYYPAGGFKVLFLVSKRTARKALGSDYHKILLKACASLCRLGSREGLVSVDSVELSEDIQAADVPAETSYYFPSRLVESLEEEKSEEVSLPILVKMEDGLIFRGQGLWIGDHERYVVPVIRRNVRGPGRLTVYQLADGGALLNVGFERESEIVVVPKEVLEE